MNDKRKLIKVINDKVSIHESVSVTKRNDEKIVGYGYGDSKGNQISADIENDSGVKHKIVGLPARNKDNELKVARILVDKINLKNKLFNNPELIEETYNIIDCISYGINDERLVLKIQIVNSNINKDYWQKVAKEGSVNLTTSIPDLINQIIEAIELKCEHYGKDSISDITLALDATNSPEYALSDVVTEIKEEYYNNFLNLGFSQIWIVGPSIEMTYLIYPE